MPYKSIYRCICCSGYTDRNGVFEFAANSLRQTIPVSHFGDIENAKIWLILTNPKGDLNDSNAGHLVGNYNVMGRENLTDKHVDEIYHHFSSYFQRMGVHPFFTPYMALLDGLVVGGHTCTFQNGNICAVDVIKCPTITDWQKFVRTNQGKIVSQNCLGRVRTPGPNHFILHQITRHNPPILIFAQSTDGLIGVEYKGNGNGSLQGISNMKTFIRTQPSKRLSISFGSNKELKPYLNQNGNTRNLRNAIQSAISAFFRR
jgi:hypothetical protein